MTDKNTITELEDALRISSEALLDQQQMLNELHQNWKKAEVNAASSLLSTVGVFVMFFLGINGVNLILAVVIGLLVWFIGTFVYWSNWDKQIQSDIGL